MSIKYNLVLFFLILLNGISFSQDYTKITVGSGPEDFFLDTFNLQERLIISFDERRGKQKNINGGIWQYDFKTEKAEELKRINEPANLEFNPHGIHIIKENEKIYVFLVNHYNKHVESEILRYLLLKDTLIFEKRFEYSSTINSVFAISKNTFYLTNDKKINGNLVLYTSGKYKNIVKHIKYPNGLYIQDSSLYFSTTFSNKIYKYKLNKNLSVSKQTKIAKIKGADNLRVYNNYLLTSSHPKLFKVIKHAKNKKKLSPSIIYAINMSNKEIKVLFKNKGDVISAASGAVIYKGYLYVAQIFENFILKIKTDLK